MGGFAWVTLATNDSYSLGALVLAHSLRRVGSKHDLAVLVTPGVTQSMREKLSAVFSLVQEVNVLDSRDETNLALLARPELGITFTKLHCWRLTQYERCVFVDADTLVVKNCDELFEREELSAAPDVGWPDCFNSGVFVFTPSQQTFASLTAFAASQGSFDGGDQGLLNSYFSDWAHKDISKHLPFIYNMCSTATYSYLPAYKQFGEDVRIIHFIGSTKPWLQYFDSVTGQVQPAPGSNHLQPLLQLWWNIFCANVHPELSPVMASTTLALHWHDILLPMAPIPINTRHHIFHDATDHTTDEIDTVQPDFSEFRDPWDSYVYEEHFSPVRDHCEDHVEQFHTHHHPFAVSVDDQSCQTLQQTHYHDHSLSVSVQGYQIEHRGDSCPVENFVGSQTNHYENYDHSVSQLRHVDMHQNHHKNHQIPSACIEFQSHQTETQTQTPPYHHIHEEHRHHENVSNSHVDKNVQFDDSQNQNHQKSPSTDYQSNQPKNQIYNHSHEDHRYHETQFYGDVYNRLTDKAHECMQQTHEAYQQSSNSNFYQSSSSHRTLDRLTDQCNDSKNSSIDVSTEKSSQSHSHPCTESTSTTRHTEKHTGDVENSCSGIAGALAQLTLGKSRSAEQVALEEHMRKYSWEQGQIDYMGRDSFENIWKKICTTLDASLPSKEKTPLKETTPPLETKKSPSLPDPESAAAPPVKEAAPAEEVVPQKPDMITQEFTSGVIIEQTSTEVPEVPAQAQEPKEAKESSTSAAEELSSKPAEVLRPVPPLLSLASSPSVLSLTSSPPILSIKEAGEKAQALTAAPKPKREEEKLEEKSETVIPLGYTSPTTFESTTSFDLSVSEKSQDSQDVPESPVPIQVAESVLEADIKESVSEHIKPVTEEAISSVSAPTQESVSAVVETLEPAVPVQAPPPLEAVPSQPNGTEGFDSDVKSDEDIPIGPASARAAPVAAPLAQPESIGLISQAEVTPGIAPSDIPMESVPEESPQVPEAVVPEVEKVPEPIEQIPETTAAKTSEIPEKVPELQEKSPESLIQSSTAEKLSEPQLDPIPAEEFPEQAPEPVVEPSNKQTEVLETLEHLTMSTPPEKHQIPGTPTVTEATPPMSPQFELSEDQCEEPKAPKKPLKKMVKKTSSEEKTESSEGDDVKKSKKVVKKVVKKPKESEDGAEGSTSEKPKKVAKVVKKVPKGETLQTDSTVPETPPPPTSDTPVPPKRKGKPGTTKTVTKKPESEQ